MSKINNLVFIGLITVLLVSVIAIAKPDTTRMPANNDRGNIPVVIPKHAIEVAPGVFSLGLARDVDGRIVEGYLIVDKRENAKPPWAGGGKGKGGVKCYALMAKGARWKTTESYVIDSNVDPITTEISLNTWDDENGFDIFGERDASLIPDGADGDQQGEQPDGKNEVMFENLGPTDTIAYTITWGIFGGKPSQRELVEWDVVFNSDYNFGNADVDPLVMDYENIATHEFGHALGLSHPDDSCTEETMYRFAETGETKKRTLNSGDIAGVSELYA